jgi:hypothetical protein
MDLRQTFFWNVLMVLSTITIFYSGYQIWTANEHKNELWNTYNTEQIGTDDLLQSKVTKLEKDLTIRKESEFKLKEDPTNLANVIPIGDGYSFFRGSSALRVETYFISASGIPRIVLNHRSVNHIASVGDSVAGGIIMNINQNEIQFMKDGEMKFLPVPNFNNLTTKSKN